MTPTEADTDVIIIGAGLSGMCTAFQLQRMGISFSLIEKEEYYPNFFRAEKVNTLRVELFRKFGLLDMRSPQAQAIGKTLIISKRWYGYFNRK